MLIPFDAAHREAYLAMARDFYASDAVDHPIPPAQMERTYDQVLAGSPYVAGYLFSHQGRIAGYALLMKTWSQEAGGIVVWVDEIYVAPEARGAGLGTAFFQALPSLFPEAAAFRLELEPDNQKARALYGRMGFSPLGYDQMVRIVQNNP